MPAKPLEQKTRNTNEKREHIEPAVQPIRFASESRSDDRLTRPVILCDQFQQHCGLFAGAFLQSNPVGPVLRHAPDLVFHMQSSMHQLSGNRVQLLIATRKQSFEYCLCS